VAGLYQGAWGKVAKGIQITLQLLTIGQTIRAEVNDTFWTLTDDACIDTDDDGEEINYSCFVKGNAWAGSSTLSVAFSAVSVLISAFGLLNFPAASDDSDADTPASL